MIQTCPTDVVAAPPERVWDLVTYAEPLARWSGTRLLAGPRNRRLMPGDRLVLAAALGLKVVFDIRALEPPHSLTVDVQLPFGVMNHEIIRITPAGDDRSRVSLG
ncbi:MAG TPA: SRPBCC family protein [Gemmatimonadales bacterium]|nr:SRPBCC family protein [Gemmatimonadales bacterium]